MDSTSAPNTSRDQKSNSTGTPYDSFYNGLQSYPEYEAFTWDNDLYQAPEQTSAFSQQATSSDPTWSQNTLQQHADQTTVPYGALPATYQDRSYSSNSFDPRQSIQQNYDNRSLPRPPPSPVSYPPYSYSQSMGYGSRDPSLTPSQTFSVTPTLSHQPSQQLPPQSFPARPGSNAFFAFSSRPSQPPNVPVCLLQLRH
jgi:hypothetical protein